jgi:hypothetical protein
MRGKRGTIVALLVAVVAFSVVFAMAATLGGVSSSKIGADNVAVAACDTDGVTTSYATSWDATDKRYEITGVTVSGVADTCDGQNLNVTMTDTSGAQLGTGTLAIPTSAATAHTVTLSTAASAKDSLGVHVLIAS